MKLGGAGSQFQREKPWERGWSLSTLINTEEKNKKNIVATKMTKNVKAGGLDEDLSAVAGAIATDTYKRLIEIFVHVECFNVIERILLQCRNKT